VAQEERAGKSTSTASGEKTHRDQDPDKEQINYQRSRLRKNRNRGVTARNWALAAGTGRLQDWKWRPVKKKVSITQKGSLFLKVGHPETGTELAGNSGHGGRDGGRVLNPLSQMRRGRRKPRQMKSAPGTGLERKA